MPYTHPLAGQKCRKDDTEFFLGRTGTCCKKGNKRIAQRVEHFALRPLVDAFQERDEGCYFITVLIHPPGNNRPWSGGCVKKRYM